MESPHNSQKQMCVLCVCVVCVCVCVVCVCVCVSLMLHQQNHLEKFFWQNIMKTSISLELNAFMNLVTLTK